MTEIMSYNTRKLLVQILLVMEHVPECIFPHLILHLVVIVGANTVHIDSLSSNFLMLLGVYYKKFLNLNSVFSLQIAYNCHAYNKCEFIQCARDSLISIR